MPKKQCECGLMIHVDNFVHKHTSRHENRMKKKKEDEEKLKIKEMILEPNEEKLKIKDMIKLEIKEMILEPNEEKLKKEFNLDNYPINNLFEF